MAVNIGQLTNQSYIWHKLEKFRKGCSEYDIKIDKDTEGCAGSPDIIKVVLEKISICDIFIADITK